MVTHRSLTGRTHTRCAVCGLQPAAIKARKLHFVCDQPRTCSACLPPFVSVEEWRALARAWDSGLPVYGPVVRVSRNNRTMMVAAVDYHRKPVVLVGVVAGQADLARWVLHPYLMPQRVASPAKVFKPANQTKETAHAC
jgi:hypothetical protein